MTNSDEILVCANSGGEVWLKKPQAGYRGIIYLACPYSHEDLRVCHDRFQLVTRKAAQLMREGFVVFSPVTHSHLIAETGLVDGLDHDFWVHQDLVFMQVCDEVHVLMLDGWRESRGVKAEIQEASRLGIPVIMEGI